MISVFQKDFYRLTGKKWSPKGWVDILLYTNVRYVFYLRVLQAERLKIFHPFVNVLRIFLSRKTGIEIRPNTVIGEGFRIFHPFCIAINENAKIGKNVNILKGATIGYACGKNPGCPKIGNNVQIGVNSTIIGGVSIGNDVLIAPNSFVNMDVPDHSVVIGNPAKITHKENATGQYVYFCV